MKRLVIIAFAALTAGCTTPAEKIDKQMTGQLPPSPALRQKIVDAARTELKDPYSVRDASISSYVPSTLKPNEGFVCVRYNAKNGFGGYTGLETIGTNVINDELRGLFKAPYQCTLGSLRWYPLPEAMQLRDL